MKLYRYLGGGRHRGARLPALRGSEWIETAIIEHGDVIEPTERELGKLKLAPYGPVSGIPARPGEEVVSSDTADQAALVVGAAADTEPKPKPEMDTRLPGPEARIQRRSIGWYDIVIDGEVVNEKALRATELPEALSALGLDPDLQPED